MIFKFSWSESPNPALNNTRHTFNNTGVQFIWPKLNTDPFKLVT